MKWYLIVTQKAEKNGGWYTPTVAYFNNGIFWDYSGDGTMYKLNPDMDRVWVCRDEIPMPETPEAR